MHGLLDDISYANPNNPSALGMQRIAAQNRNGDATVLLQFQ